MRKRLQSIVMHGRIVPTPKNELFRASSDTSPPHHPERASRHRVRRHGLRDRGSARPDGISQARLGAGVDEGGVPGLRRGSLEEGVRGGVGRQVAVTTQGRASMKLQKIFEPFMTAPCAPIRYSL